MIFGLHRDFIQLEINMASYLQSFIMQLLACKQLQQKVNFIHEFGDEQSKK
jgi:hypothetical protein